MNWSTVKLIILSIFLVAIAFAFLFAVTPAFYVLREFFNPNRIIVKTTDAYNIDHVEIYWTSEVTKPLKVFSNGQELNVIYKEYGFNDFDILFKGDTLISFSYFKTNNWHGHTHIITLARDSVIVRIKGTDEKRIFSKKMRKEIKQE